MGMEIQMNGASNLGFPRMGKRRELKFALEKYWAGESSEEALLTTAAELRRTHWKMQVEAGIATPPSNDFSLYDHVLDMAATLGAVPERFESMAGNGPGAATLATYFAMARGSKSAPALEMTKWFDTNYHYVVPEFESGMRYELRSIKALNEYLEAKTMGIETRPVLLGPVSFVLLGKPTDEAVSRESVLKAILPLYRELLTRLAAAGADWIQIDEPCLCLDLADAALYRDAYVELRDEAPKLMLTTYFGELSPNLDLALELGTAGLHVDLVRAPHQLDALLAKANLPEKLSLGLVDGRNIWRTDIQTSLTSLQAAIQAIGKDRVEVAPSCSLLHSPVDLDAETRLDSEVLSWMAFAKQKLAEVALLANAIDGEDRIQDALEENKWLVASRKNSPRIHKPEVAAALAAIGAGMASRKSAYPIRREKQSAALELPLLPTTTIGSFPQTAEVRKLRAGFRAGKIDGPAYEKFIEEETERCIRFQESVGLDVLVHGEFERIDMVDYFGEQLDGFVFTENGWVQSYGSRCVKPPIIFGDVSRPHPMTVRWSRYAQSLTNKLMKGMLTGPVTILQWSFVRDDQPRSQTCNQIALAIREEVRDLEAAGIRIIQIDEPAIREGLPLRRKDWPVYLDWSVKAFRIAASGVEDETQIHTHMCYSEFNDMIDSIVAMDADVISIECSRSRMELLDAFHRVHYPNQIGPGVYDIHSPRVPEDGKSSICCTRRWKCSRRSSFGLIQIVD